MKIITEEVSEEKDGRRKRKKIRKATVVDLYENFILLRIKIKAGNGFLKTFTYKTKAGNGFLETFTYQEFECMRK